MSRAPLIADIRSNALDDGPGIRSTVFFKGCPLRCVWCQNPETLSVLAELQREAGRCVGCQQCACCPQGAVSFVDGARSFTPERPAGARGTGARQYDGNACSACGECVDACPSGALRIVGTSHPVERLVELLLADEPFYRSSGGGVTFSGGEPTMHLDYLVELSRQLKQREVHLLLETCGHYATEHFEQQQLSLLDMIYFDLKLADPDQHRAHTSLDNRRILSNLERLARLAPQRVLVRVPLVPGITDGPDNLVALARIIRGVGLGRVALLPYNPLWIAKRQELGLPLPYQHGSWMPEETVLHCQEVVEREGLESL